MTDNNSNEILRIFANRIKTMVIKYNNNSNNDSNNNNNINNRNHQ